MADLTTKRTMWLAALVGVLLSAALVRWDIGVRRAAFQAEARTVHRQLSQRAAQHDAMLATLVLLGGATDADVPPTRLPALYPHVLAVWRRASGEVWPNAAVSTGEARSRQLQRPVATDLDGARGQYTLVLAGEPASYALRLDVARWVPWDDWPIDRRGAVRVALSLGDAEFVLQAGDDARGWARGVTPGFVFDQVLDTSSQPFVVRLQRPTGPADWPWAGIAALVAATAATAVGALAWRRQRAQRRRAEALLRVARTARLNALGAFAAGLAHELNQPLTAVLATTAAARRLIDDEPLPRATLQQALGQARDQARRAADVVARLRRQLERPDDAARREPVELAAVTRQALDLLQPQAQRLAVQVDVSGDAVRVLADPVALEQIVHNLLVNALQALETMSAGARQLHIVCDVADGRGVWSVRDNGPGLAPAVLARLFEPFNSTREGGLGLGLSLCAELAESMGGRLTAQNEPPHGAALRLDLPLADRA